MATKLGLYQEALELLGERPLASLTEEREPRRALDGAYDRTVAGCLEAGFWNFALRSVELEAEAAITPAFQFNYAFQKPTDWVRTFIVSPHDEFTFVQDYPFLDENGYWHSDDDPLYVRYVSNDTDFGIALGNWPQSFTTYVATSLARRIVKRISNSQTDLETLFKLESRAKAEAQSKDAMNEGPKSMPAGSWVMSRLGGASGSRWNDRFR
jgi:hypothetical protein